MPIDILMPALSPTMEEGTLAKWHVKVGDTVKSGDVIAEIETDKATMEVEAVDEGVVEEILVPEGTEEVKVNAPIAPAERGGRDRGSGAEGGRPGSRRSRRPKRRAEPRPPRQRRLPPPAPAAAPPPRSRDGDRIFASPLARRIAGQKGLDLAALKGSGPHGRIIKADVESAQPGQAKAIPAARRRGRRPPRHRRAASGAVAGAAGHPRRQL